jgi:hypothetical protein
MIEQPAYAFGKLIDQLRLIAITPPDAVIPRVYIAPHAKSNFETVVQYYFPGQEDFISPEMKDFDSEVLAEMAHKQLLQEWIQAAMPEWKAEDPLSLLYRGSRDGYGADDFHAKCDGAPATVTLVKSTRQRWASLHLVPW